MSTTKPPKSKINVSENPIDKSEREARRDELMEKYPEGKVWIQPICDYHELVSMQNPRREDHFVPRITIIKVPVSTMRGTHPHTGLPKVEDKYVPIHLIDPDLKWPVDVRSDLIRGLGKTVLDPWDLLDFLDSFPGREHLFNLLRVDPIIDQRIEASMKSKGTKAALHEVVNPKRTRPAEAMESKPVVTKKSRKAGGTSFDEGLAGDAEETYEPVVMEEA